ncbi:MAG: FAD:protein FMN transferase [Phycisphaeraceae bacterium]|nr:FAD:protein FMN transferase [Phycisphaeraceae bacterium]
MIKLACHAMGTRFELALRGRDAALLRAAGQQALDEIAIWHDRLSPFDPASEISRINAHAGEPAVAVDAETFEFLTAAVDLARQTGGLFDPTLGPLMEAWGFRGDPIDADAARRAPIGWEHIELDPGKGRVRLRERGMRLDPGAIGKGWALDRAAELLRRTIEGEALLHGGTSSVIAIGGAALDPRERLGCIALTDDATMPYVLLHDAALGVSMPSGRTAHLGGEALGHVLDPTTRRPARGAVLAVAIAESAAAADAWSTAILVAAERPAGTPEEVTTYVVPRDGPPQGPTGRHRAYFVIRTDSAREPERPS